MTLLDRLLGRTPPDHNVERLDALEERTDAAITDAQVSIGVVKRLLADERRIAGYRAVRFPRR